MDLRQLKKWINELPEEELGNYKVGWLKAKDLQNGDKVIGVKGESTIKNIIEWVYMKYSK